MLYSYELLCKKPRGKFALIWLLANDMKVSDRDILKISIYDFVKELEEIPESQLSMYLQSKLCYGAVLAHSRQIDLLIDRLKNLAIKSVPAPLPKQKKNVKPKKKTITQGEYIQGEDAPVQEMQEGAQGAQSMVDEMFLSDLEVDILKHIDESGAAVRVDESRITLNDEEGAFLTAEPEQDQGFGEMEASLLEEILFGEIRDAPVPEPQKRTTQDIPDIHVEAAEVIPGETTVLPEPQTPTLSSMIPATDVRPAAETDRLSVRSPVPKHLPIVESPQPLPAPKPVPSQEPTQPLQLSQTVGSSQSTIIMEQEMELLSIIPSDSVETEQRERRRKRSHLIVDEVTQIPRDKIRRNIATVGDTLRVQNPRDDIVDVRKLRNIIPGNKLLRSARRNIHLDHLITRNFVTKRGPAELDLTKAPTRAHSILPDKTFTAVPEGHSIIEQEGGPPEAGPPEAGIETAIVQQIEHEQEARAVPEGPSAIEQEGGPPEAGIETAMVQQIEHEQEARAVPEGPSTIEQDGGPPEAGIETATVEQIEHEQEARLNEILSRIINHLQEESQLTFESLFPPSTTDRVTAMRMLEMLIELEDRNEITLTQALDICPPVVPHPPIYITRNPPQEPGYLETCHTE